MPNTVELSPVPATAPKKCFPKPLEGVDWQLGAQMFADGHKLCEISKAIGVKRSTLTMHAKRFDWKGEKHKAVTKSVAVTLSTAVKAAVATLNGKKRPTEIPSYQLQARTQPEMLRHSLTAEVEHQINLLAESPPSHIDELRSRGQGRTALVKELVSTASTLCGWDNEKDAGGLNFGDVEQLQINVLQGPIAGQEVSQPSVPTIDVQTVQSVPDQDKTEPG